MDRENKHSGAGFFNGFILGLLVGAGLVFLFGTNKGRRVLQMLLEQVEENTQLSDLLEVPEEEEFMDAIEEDDPALDEDYEDEEEMKLEEEEPEKKDIRHEFQNGHSHEHREHHEVVSKKPVAKVKRFFRGPSKKMVS
ncbi:MAG TPA: YtxH domain-containing protein [Patescibacteria group bacterium]